jgi:ring-1,2-phenylacetyl-CoA epoxidase subunit PaaE
MTGQRKELRIRDSVQGTKDARTFVLETVDGSSISYKAGQFLTFIFDTPAGEQRRNYSLSSAPVLNEPLSITIKRIPNGVFSRAMVDKARQGDRLTTIGASGFFTLPDDMRSIRQLFLLAAGSGITPVFSLLKTALHLYPGLVITLIYSNHSKEDAIFYEALHQLREEHPQQLQIEWLFSTAPDYTRARLGNWLLNGLLQKYRVAPLSSCLFYTCGPFDYMRMITITLLSAGVLPGHIRKEEFVIPQLRVELKPPDTSSRQVTVVLNKMQYRFSSEYPLTILQSAKRSGIELPYSCETGRCGTCAAVCKQGKVWMKYNEVLTGEDIQAKKVLTCTGYPIEGDVELDFDAI